MQKTTPFNLTQIKQLAADHSTPFYVYDEVGIRATCQGLNESFKNSSGYKNFFAVKALPNPEIMKLVLSEGMGFDASSMAELELCVKAGAMTGDIMFTSNDTAVEEYRRAIELGAFINLDDISEIDFFDDNNLELPEVVSFRYNPGSDRVNTGNDIIGQPEEAKYGLTHEQIIEAYRICQERGKTRFGLHTMIVSNELKYEAHIETMKTVFGLALEVKEKLGIEFDYINIGGGYGIPYEPDEFPLDVAQLGRDIATIHQEMIVDHGLKPIRVVSEHGRYVTGPHGYLVTTVGHIKDTYKKYVGTDATMANLMRPAIYGAYHHITVLGKEDLPSDQVYDVVGSLCENNDKFAVNRSLPKIELDDVLVIHDVGAHGHAMGFNYNGKLRSAEFLLDAEGRFKMIRRAETLEDYFATINFTDSLQT